MAAGEAAADGEGAAAAAAAAAATQLLHAVASAAALAAGGQRQRQQRRSGKSEGEDAGEAMAAGAAGAAAARSRGGRRGRFAVNENGSGSPPSLNGGHLLQELERGLQQPALQEEARGFVEEMRAEGGHVGLLRRTDVVLELWQCGDGLCDVFHSISSAKFHEGRCT